MAGQRRPRLDVNHLATLVALVVILIIAAVAGYQLQIGSGGLVFSPSVTAMSH